jgi:Rieske Fe-S protein
VSGSNRRSFLLQLWQALWGGVATGTAAPLLTSCTRPAAKIDPQHGTTVDVSRLEAGATVVAPAPGPDGAPILVVAESEGHFHALSLSCTHEGCPVRATPVDGILICPCHGSRFDLEGHVVQGPAEFPLGRYDSSYDPKHRRLVITFG